MNRFINDDFKVTKGGRKAPKISIDELRNKIISRAKKVANVGELDASTYEDGEKNDLFLTDCILVLQSNDSNIVKDMKYLINSENTDLKGNKFSVPYEGTPYIGFHTLPNGLTFLGSLMAGDWEFPAVVFYYYDGKNIRCYIPTYGNTVNADFKTAFGSEGENEKIDMDRLIEKNKDYEDCEETDDFSIAYVKRYDLNYNAEKGDKKLFINWDAVILEFSERVEMI